MTAHSKSTQSLSAHSLRTSRLALTGFSLSVVCALLASLAGFGSRWGLWHFRVGLIIMIGVLLGGLVAVVLSLIGATVTRPGGSRRGLVWALLGLLIGLVVVGLPLSLVIRGRRVPPIHDITTDTETPPPFVAILPLRQGVDNPSEYGGAEIARQQRTAYPKVAPLILDVTPEQSFERALTAARDMGWEIIEANPREGRIEATAMTFWFGFKDDVVIRITPAGGGSRIDVRSVSRVGTSDVGANAKRIETFLNKLGR